MPAGPTPEWTSAVAAIASAIIAVAAAAASTWQAASARGAAHEAKRQADAALREVPPDISLVPASPNGWPGGDLDLIVANHNRRDMHLVALEVSLPDALTISLERDAVDFARGVSDRLGGSPGAPIVVDLRGFTLPGTSLGGGETHRLAVRLHVSRLTSRPYPDRDVEIRATIAFDLMEGSPNRTTRALPVINIPFVP